MQDKAHIALFFTYNMSVKRWDNGGMLDREVQLYHKLIEKGYRVSFITYGDESEFEFSEKLGKIILVPLYSFKNKSKTKIGKFIDSLLLPYTLRKELKSIDIYKTNQIWGGWAAIISKFMHKGKAIARCGFEPNIFAEKGKYSWWLRKSIGAVSWFIYKFSDTIIVSSQLDKKYILSKFNILPEKINISMNYVETEAFKPLETIEKLSRILFVGRLTYQKNLFNLLDAIKNLPVGIDIVGDGELNDRLRDYVKENSIDCNFLGRISNDDLPLVINRYLVYVLCSRYEGTPKTLLEAMSCGVAVIGTDVTGINNIIENRQNGLICDVSSDSISKVIKELLQDKALQRKLGANGRKFILDNCSLSNSLRKEIEIYEKLLA